MLLNKSPLTTSQYKGLDTFSLVCHRTLSSLHASAQDSLANTSHNTPEMLVCTNAQSGRMPSVYI